MRSLAEETQVVLDSLKRTAAETLKRKRRLGHYAVVWRDGKPVAIGEDAPDDQGEAPKGDLNLQR